MKLKNIIIGIVMCLIAGLCGYGVRYIMNQNENKNTPTATPSYTEESTVEPTSTPVALKDNEQRYYAMENDDWCYDYYYEETEPQSSIADAGFTYPDYQSYVIQDNGIVSVEWQDLLDSRSSNDNYQINDYYFAYTGKTSVVANNDTAIPNKLVPYDETNAEFLTADLGVHYIQIEGNIPNIDAINETLRKISLTGLGSLENAIYLNNDDFEYIDDGKTEGCWDVYARSDAYVLYNDDKLISIGVYENNNMGTYSVYPYLKSINIDLETGEVLDFDYFVTPDMSLVNSFKAECKKQSPNLEVIYEMDDDTLLSYLKGEMSLPPILIVCEDHLEIGIDMETDGYYGFTTFDFNYDDYPQMNPFNK